MAKLPKQDELLDFSFDVPKTGWMHTPTEFKEGMYCYGTKPKNLEVVGMPNGHDWSPADEDWHLPEGWKDIVLNGTSVEDAAAAANKQLNELFEAAE